MKKVVLTISGLLVLAVGVTIGWASFTESMFEIPHVVLDDPWFLMSIVDVYAGIILFYLWVFYKEACWVKRLSWFVIFVLLGNIATAFYLFVAALRLPSNPTAKDLLLRADHA